MKLIGGIYLDCLHACNICKYNNEEYKTGIQSYRIGRVEIGDACINLIVMIATNKKIEHIYI